MFKIRRNCFHESKMENIDNSILQQKLEGADYKYFCDKTFWKISAGNISSTFYTNFGKRKCIWSCFQVQFAIWTNISYNSAKYNLVFGEIQFNIWRNPIWCLEKYNLVFGQIYLMLLSSSVCRSARHELQSSIREPSLEQVDTKIWQISSCSLKLLFDTFFIKMFFKYQISPVVGFLLASLCLAGAVCHKSIRFISDPLRLRPRRVRAGEGEG